MSKPTRMASKSTATIWRSNGVDKYGAKSYSAPEAFLCTFGTKLDNNYTDGEGVKFTPELVAWYEDDGKAAPTEGDFIAKGDQTAFADPTDTELAMPVKMTEISDCSLFNEPDDIMVAS